MIVRNPIVWFQVYTGLYPHGAPSVTCKHLELALHQALALYPASSLRISDSLRKSLLVEEDDDPIVPLSEEQATPEYLCHGLPKTPYYKTLAQRLYCLKEQQQSNEKSNLFFAIPAEQLGLEELIPPTIDSIPPFPDCPTLWNTKQWIETAGQNDAILRLLGMRRTIGTSEKVLLPPSRAVLRQAAKKPHHGKLSVAARARAKHAHRCQPTTEESFFGVAKGNPQQQTEQAQEYIEQFLEDAVWCNIHVFGGINSEEQAVLELRLSNGYGGRWIIGVGQKDGEDEVQFRGFLEPQMENGHEKGWRH